jgi:hypothetical protein
MNTAQEFFASYIFVVIDVTSTFIVGVFLDEAKARAACIEHNEKTGHAVRVSYKPVIK